MILHILNEDFIKHYNEESDEGYFPESDAQYLQKLPERVKVEKFGKLVANLHDKSEYVTHIRNLKQILNHGLVLNKLQRIFEFNQNVWLKPYIDMNANLEKKAKKCFWKRFF